MGHTLDVSEWVNSVDAGLLCINSGGVRLSSLVPSLDPGEAGG